MDVLLLVFVMSLVFGGASYGFFSSNSSSPSGPYKINDKNWMVNGKLISFDKDTPILRMHQEMEDNKHYRAYEHSRLMADKERVFEYWERTIKAIHDRPDLKDCVTEEKLNSITEEYDKYVFMCEKLGKSSYILSKEQFLIKKENPFFCIGAMAGMQISRYASSYTIHNEKTARYYPGNMTEIMEKEFKEKWY